MSTSNKAAELALAALKAALDGGNLYLYAGTPPADPDDALDMVSEHTELVKMTVDGDGVTGLTFAAPSGTTMTKNGSEVWKGPVSFDGAVAGPGTLTPTFYRFCALGDNGRAAAGANPRIQGIVGGPLSSAALKLGSDTLTDNGSNTQGATGFFVSQSQIS